MKYIIPIEPMGKPRMTQSDKWNKRKVTSKYWRFKDKLREALREILVFTDIKELSWTAYFSIPKSAAKENPPRTGTLHRIKPDRDNIDKAILDAILKDDSVVACGYLEKRWDDGKGARIELEIN